MAFPATPLDVEVSLALSADLSDPGSWSWTDITDYVREGNRVRIRRGRSSERSTIPPSRCTLIVDNTDGRFCRFLPTGAWYGQIGPNTPIRVRVNNGSGYVTRFVGYVSGWPPSWDPSESDQTVQLVADGILRRLGQGRVLRSAQYRTMAGVSPDDYQPVAYWPLEDGSESTRFASGLAGGTSASVGGTVNFAADDGVASSDPLPTFEAGATAAFVVPTYTNTGQWILQMLVKPSATGLLFRVTTAGGTGRRIDVALNFSTNEIEVDVYDAGGGSLLSMSATIPATVVGEWVTVTLASRQNTGGGNGQFDIGLFTDGGFTTWSTGDVVATAVFGRVTTITLAPAVETSFGHVALYVAAAFAIGLDDTYNARAIGGWAGEMAHDRVERLCREERVPVTVTATTSQAMGAQRNSTLVALLRECATTDFGLLYEPADAAGLAFLSSSERFNLTPAITLEYDQGHIAPPWDPTDDDRDTRNDVTASRFGGSSARVTDEASITAIGVYDDTLSVNTETDDQLDDVAGWAINLGTVDELRWPAVKPNFRDHPSLIDDWMAADLGSQLHVTGHPSPLAPDEIEQIIEGYDETLGSYEYTTVANLSPASGWVVAELDDDVLGKLDTDGSDLTATVNSTATALSVATQTGTSPLWPTDAGEMPIPLIVSGEVMSATAIAAPTTVTFGAAGTASHASNASVTPGIPASVATGNLLLCLAAIRNSGAGVPNTPSGYTRLPVFETTDNVQLFAKVATSSGEVAPTITFTGGVANATTSAQMCRIAGAFSTPAEAFVIAANQLNASAQDIGYPCLALTRPQLNTTINNAIVFYLGWKQDDWTSVATLAGAAEIGEASSTTGDDQGLVWDYTIQTTATDIAAGSSFVVTGGASAISRGAVVAIRSNVQAVTVTRSVNGVVKAQSAGTAVNVHKPARLAL